MLKVHNGNRSVSSLVVTGSTNQSQGFTEYEEDIHFDEDDPDFMHHHVLPSIFITIPTTNHKMSLASVHPVEIHSSHSSLTLSHSLEDMSSISWSSQVEQQQVMTIEQLRDQLTSCFTCGVSWSDLHVSLDCRECGGYSIERPCPECDGRCGSTWKRDLTTSHSTGKARWIGECLKEPDPQSDSLLDASSVASTTFATATAEQQQQQQQLQQLQQLQQQQVMQDLLCQRLEKLTAASSWRHFTL